MTAERDALAELNDEQAYGIAAKVMARWPVATVGMYAAIVRAGYRAAIAALRECVQAADARRAKSNDTDEEWMWDAYDAARAKVRQ